MVRKDQSQKQAFVRTKMLGPDGPSDHQRKTSAFGAHACCVISCDDLLLRSELFIFRRYNRDRRAIVVDNIFLHMVTFLAQVPKRQ